MIKSRAAPPVPSVDAEISALVTDIRRQVEAGHETSRRIAELGVEMSRQTAVVVQEFLLPVLDDAITGDLEAIVRRYDLMLQLGSLGPGLIGAGIDMFGARAGVGSVVGSVFSAVVNFLAAPRLRRALNRAEEAYRRAAVMTLTLFLIPFAACTLGYLRIAEYGTKRSALAVAASMK